MLSYLISKEGIEENIGIEQAVKRSRERENFFWMDLNEDEFDLLDPLSDFFDLHKLSIEDCKNKDQQPKVEMFENYVFVIVRVPDLESSTGELETNQLSLFIGENFIISVHHKALEFIKKVGESLGKNNRRSITVGPGRLAHNLVDRGVDKFLVLMERLDEEIEELEEQIFEDPQEEILEDISDLRGDLLYLRRIIVPERDQLNKLIHADAPFIKEESKAYFRDIQDNLARVQDLLSNYRELISGARDSYMSMISNKMNEVMKTLTIIATIFIPLTFLAGIYGMNFSHMPELGWPWSYYSLLGFMGLITAGMFYYFKKKGWF